MSATETLLITNDETALMGVGVHRLVRHSVAALFVQPDGCYAGMPGVDIWPEERDARKYNGPWPVVAHPPCQRYGNLGVANYARWGGEHNRPLNDGGCFAAALAAVNCWGGVMEHPAYTKAWATYNLTAPKTGRWTRSGIGWVCEVWQSAYGHRATKKTWLYWRGEGMPEEMDWSQPIGTHQVGFQDQRGKARNKPTLSPREANATPPSFRDALLRLAYMSNTDSPTLRISHGRDRHKFRTRRCRPLAASDLFAVGWPVVIRNKQTT